MPNLSRLSSVAMKTSDTGLCPAGVPKWVAISKELTGVTLKASFTYRKEISNLRKVGAGQATG